MILCSSVSRWRILRVSQPVGRLMLRAAERVGRLPGQAEQRAADRAIEPPPPQALNEQQQAQERIDRRGGHGDFLLRVALGRQAAPAVQGADRQHRHEQSKNIIDVAYVAKFVRIGQMITIPCQQEFALVVCKLRQGEARHPKDQRASVLF